MYQSLTSLQEDTQHALSIQGDEISIKDPLFLRNTFIDKLLMTAMFSVQSEIVSQVRRLIRHIATIQGVKPRSIYPLYMAIAEGKVSGFTVPAINIRTLTYDMSRLIFSLAKQYKIGAFVLEIARSEMGYTEQPPELFSLAVLAAAIKEDYRGPLFLQGDHFQFHQKVFAKDPKSEILALEKLIDEALAAKFYNIDIDASTLVDLSRTDLTEQQQNNFTMTAHLTNYIRRKQPHDITVSIGGEIGHIGDKNSTVSDFDAFMTGFLKKADKPGLSKVSVQTGTSHGGTPLPDGTLAKKSVDFSILTDIGKRARHAYHMAGAVQHGASTLPLSDFSQFPKAKALEIHLSTEFQNIIYETMPKDLQRTIDTWLTDNMKDEWNKDWNKAQFLYKTRKKALGPFKKEIWSLRDEEKRPIREKLKTYLTTLFTDLQVHNTLDVVSRYE